MLMKTLRVAVKVVGQLLMDRLVRSLQEQKGASHVVLVEVAEIRSRLTRWADVIVQAGVVAVIVNSPWAYRVCQTRCLVAGL